MYKHYEKLSPEEVESLLALSKEVEYKDSRGSRMRVGYNGAKACSIYKYSKWFDWKHTQREFYKTTLPEVAIPKVVQCWFLEIPENNGFLDLMDYWVDKPLSGRIIATALRDQTIIINGNPVKVLTGEQIGFSLCTLHEIRKSREGQLWACAMIRGCHTEIHG